MTEAVTSNAMSGPPASIKIKYNVQMVDALVTQVYAQILQMDAHSMPLFSVLTLLNVLLIHPSA